MSDPNRIPRVRVFEGDCRDRLREMADDSIDAVVTDPPYGLGKQPDMLAVLEAWTKGEPYHQSGGGFMGKDWDSMVPGPDVWREVYRVMKPGAHALVFAGTRTVDLMGLALRLAGFEIRDQIAWIYGSGFPKSLDVSKAIDAATGHIRSTDYVPNNKNNTHGKGWGGGTTTRADPPITDEAKRWNGWGTAMKPAVEPVIWAQKPVSPELEPVIVARKPLIGTVAQNVMEHGTGAINIDGCRVGTDEALGRFNHARSDGVNYVIQRKDGIIDNSRGLGRWPANLIHDGSPEVVGLFPQTASGKMMPTHTGAKQGDRVAYGADRAGGFTTMETYGDSGSAARFFYCAKAQKEDREEGLEGFDTATAGELTGGRKEGSAELNNPRAGAGRTSSGRANLHPTVKPTDLMRYLCRLVTPPGGTVLDPFGGSGSTGKAAALERFDAILLERNPEYVKIAAARIEHAIAQLSQIVMF